MIDVIKQTPEVYSKLSRDYQVIARLFTALYNSSKMYSDNLHVWDLNIDNKLSLLRAKTLNFETKHAWDLDPLDAAVSCFKYLIRTKGTGDAIKKCIQVLMRVYRLSGRVIVEIHDGSNIEIKIPTLLANIGIVQDLFDYVIPAGCSYRIKAYRLEDTEGNSLFEVSDETTKSVIDNINVSILESGNTIYHNAVETNYKEKEVPND